MRLKQKRVVKIGDYLVGLADGGTFRVMVEATPDRLAKAGFPAIPAIGTTVLPNIVGPVSRFNAEGKWEVHRDQPKESRYVRTVHWRWTEWNGPDRVEREDFRDIYRDCYPRDLVEPPSAELTFLFSGGQGYLVSEVLLKDEASFDRAKHVVNLFLELFGECEIVTADLVSLPTAVIKRVNWKMLPPGEYPWQKLEEHIRQSHGARSEGDLMFIMDRQLTINNHGPDKIFVGQGGFSDYVAYQLSDRGIVVMESIRRDNAIYIFGEDWAEVSQLTKSEVLNGSRHLARIIHSKGWKDRLAQRLRRAA